MPFIILGVAIGSIIHGFLPADMVVQLAGANNPLAVPVSALVGIPLYLRASTMVPIATSLMAKGMSTGAECIVTACAMCHLNLEIRCLPENRIPIFHFSELLALALEGKFSRSWLKRHLIDPAPLLEEKLLINSRASAGKAKAPAQHP